MAATPGALFRRRVPCFRRSPPDKALLATPANSRVPAPTLMGSLAVRTPLSVNLPALTPMKPPENVVKLAFGNSAGASIAVMLVIVTAPAQELLAPDRLRSAPEKLMPA